MGNIIKGLTGEVIQHGERSIPAYTDNPRDIDVNRMAWWAMNYLARSPRPELNYQPIFQVFPRNFPSVREGDDPVVNCDTDARMDWEWFYMRDITRSEFDRDIEENFHARIRSYLDYRGLAVTHPGCHHEDWKEKVWTETDNVLHMWGTVKILLSLSLDYARTGNEKRRAQAMKTVLSLKNIFIWGENSVGSFAYPPDGMCPLTIDGRPQSDRGQNANQPLPCIYPLLMYGILCGDDDGIDFARACTVALYEHSAPRELEIKRDGTFCGHTHATMHALWGAVEYGLYSGERKYVDFVKNAFDRMAERGTGTGWFPAMPDSCNETCAVSDMISIACALGRTGYSEYFDYAERFFRNHIANQQFILTPEVKTHYKRMHSDKPDGEVNRQLSLLEKVQGVIIGGAGINDYENELLGYESGYSLFGCCGGEGLRAIHTVWDAALKLERGGKYLPDGLYVNMELTLENENGRLVSFMPDVGGVKLVPAFDTAVFVRIPHWASRDKVTLTINGTQRAPQWDAAHPMYLRLDAKAGDIILTRYPLALYANKASVWKNTRPDLDVTFYWLGNMVVETDPAPGHECLPLYTGMPRLLSAPPQ